MTVAFSTAVLPVGRVSGRRPWSREDVVNRSLLRLDRKLADHLQTVAQVEGRTVSDVAREAITALVHQRRKDQRFIKLLEETSARHQRILDMLQEDESS